MIPKGVDAAPRGNNASIAPGVDLAGFGAGRNLVWIAAATCLPSAWFVRDWPWVWLAIPLTLCALPLASRRHQSLLAGIDCAILTVAILASAFFGGAVFLPAALLLFCVAVPARARWITAVVVSAFVAAEFLDQPAPDWRELGWAFAGILVITLGYRAQRLAHVARLARQYRYMTPNG